MKSKLYLLAALIMPVLLSGCAKASYVGITHSPTLNVDLFMEEKAISRPHEVMGHISVEGASLVSTEKLQEKLIEVAREKGADAVLIEGLEEVYTGSSTSTSGTSSTDKKGNEHFHASSYTSQDKHRILKATLLKYTD